MNVLCVKVLELDNSNIGKPFEVSNIIKEDCNCYNDSGEIIFKLKKNVIPVDMQNDIINIFKTHSKKLNYNRNKATSDKKRVTKNNISLAKTPCRSNIVGYFDTPPRQIRSQFKNMLNCRTTAFTKHNKDKWEKSLPFFKIINDTYKELAPEHYNRQLQAINKVPDNFKIKNTVFTTCTINYNFRTMLHKDVGDFKDGLGTLVILGTDFKGCELIFPEYNIGVEIRPGDMLVMNVHEYHCNNPLEADNNNFRMAFVSYLRNNMTFVNKQIFIDNEEYYICDLEQN